MIPKIIHQSYKSTVHPYPVHWQKSWKEKHSDWSYHFHTDDDNRKLVIDHCPQFLTAFDAFPQGIMKADFARFLYLYVWGGLYADLDYVCLKPFDTLLEQISHFGVPELPNNTYYHYHNALLISEPGNTFWLECAEQAVQYSRSSEQLNVESLAGPIRLQEAVKSEEPKFTPLSAELVTPIDWFSLVHWGKPDQEVAMLCRRLRDSSIGEMCNAFPEAYAVTFWDRQW